MDIAYILDYLVPAAIYFGSLTDNSREAYDALRWEDEREKPSWDDILASQHLKPLEPLLDRLSLIIDKLPDEVQAQFGGAIAPAYVALKNGKPNVAKIMVQNLTVPTELEQVKMDLLAEFER